MTAAGPRPAVRFTLLGPLEVWHGDVPVPIPAGRARVLLATLLLRANQPVPVDALVERLWGDAAPNPDRVKATLQMAVRRLRQALGDANVVRTATNAYVAEVDPESVDLHRFRRLAAGGRHAEALALWRGEPLSDVESDALHREDVEPLRDEWLAVLERRVEADLAAGRAAGLVPELRALTRAYPLRERFWGQLVLALHGSDRQGEALAAFREVRELLAEELGVDPSEYLRAVHRTVLAGDARPALTPWTALCQLPPDTADFIGRDDLCARASALLTDRSRTAVPVVAITGAPGTGKSTLTVRVAHALRDRFPDGQLFVRLDGAGAAPRDPAEVLAELLTAVGLNPAAMPDRLEARAAAFRSRVADRAVLLVLDDAARFDQVRHLLPGTATSAVLISSRHLLGGLPGVHSLRVPPLTASAGLALLSRVIGDGRVEAEAGAAASIAEACGGLPLALRIVGARLAARPSLPLAKLADRLADERRRLDELAAGDLEVRAGLELSYEALPPDAALAFRRLGLIGASDVASWAVKALTGLADPEQPIERLVEANLLEEVGRDATGEPRYRLHDILAVYAAELVEQDDGGTRALRAYLDALTALADAACHRLAATVDELPLIPAEPSTVLTAAEVDRLTEDGVKWLLVEQVPLERAIEVACRRGWGAVAAGLYQRTVRYLDVYIPLDRVAELAERVAGVLHAGGDVRLAWGVEFHRVYQLLKRSVEDGLLQQLERCAEVFGQHGDTVEEAIALATLAHYGHINGQESAIDLARRAVEAGRNSGSRTAYCSTVRELALILGESGRHRESLACFEEALAISRDLGPLPEAQVHYGIARCALDSGDVDRAVEAVDRAVRLVGTIDDPRAAGWVTNLAGRVKLAAGDHAEGVRLAGRAHRIFVDIGEGIGVVDAVASMAEGYLELGRPEDALAVLEPAMREYRDVGAAQAIDRLRQALQRASAVVPRPGGAPSVP
ncbi:DNA-binding SARP family transcriptional activator [Saccharothrix saharensis]|uniref:DNA-binding SARP family transcriptional activator n=1 Tax=Saccharothrix saharensis TaxID=571190 RepID=A0A543JI97_9PSEU|nr:BTAD domain-containing putative transcriptional regulator [Saccharothrix saharensis]TQM82543.1 DNA-binding SARP family transcriptional activator [Saccharothrix saharensis]